MQIEQSLAAKKISQLLALGFGKSVCVRDAEMLVKSQGFSAEHAQKVAAEMFELIAE